MLISASSRVIQSRIVVIILVEFACYHILADIYGFMHHIYVIWNIFVQSDEKDIIFHLLSAIQKDLFW